MLLCSKIRIKIQFSQRIVRNRFMVLFRLNQHQGIRSIGFAVLSAEDVRRFGVGVAEESPVFCLFLP